MRIRPRRGAGERGFTLIELLIALTLVGLLSVVLVGGLRFGTRLWETGDQRGAALSQLETVQRLLRRQIGQAVLVRPGEDADAPSSFEGTAEGLRFIAPLPPYVGVGGLYRFELKTAEGDSELGLELLWQLYRPDQEEWFVEEDLTRRTLIEGIEEARFSYYGIPEGAADPEWSEAWDSDNGLPSLFSLEIAFPEGDPRPWPLLTVAFTGSNNRRR
jgi:general secretion pathway protein J